VLALLSKSVTATLAAALLVVFWWQRGRLTWRRGGVPLPAVVRAGSGDGHFQPAWVEQTLIIGSRHGEFALSLLERGLLAGRGRLVLSRQTALAGRTVFIYPRWTVSAAVLWQYAFSLAALGLLAGPLGAPAAHACPLGGGPLVWRLAVPALGF